MASRIDHSISASLKDCVLAPLESSWIGQGRGHPFPEIVKLISLYAQNEKILRSPKELIEEQLISRKFQITRGLSESLISSTICSYLHLRRPKTVFIDSGINLFISNFYDTLISQHIVTLDQANIFGLCENHDDDISPWRALNGHLISFLSNYYKLTIFLESWPSWKKPEESTENLCKNYFITSSRQISFLGWDASDELMEPIRQISRDFRVKRQTLKTIGTNFDACLEEIEKLCPGFFQNPNVNLQSFSFDILTKINSLLDRRQSLQIEYTFLLNEIEKENAYLNQLILQTFRARTRAMVATLKKLRHKKDVDQDQMIYIFIGGAFHFCEERNCAPERRLGLLYEEMHFHKIAILRPRIVMNYSDAQISGSIFQSQWKPISQ